MCNICDDQKKDVVELINDLKEKKNAIGDKIKKQNEGYVGIDVFTKDETCQSFSANIMGDKKHISAAFFTLFLHVLNEKELKHGILFAFEKALKEIINKK